MSKQQQPAIDDEYAVIRKSMDSDSDSESECI